MSFQLSKNSIKRLKGVHPDLITIFTEAIKSSPIDFGIPNLGGVRTQGEQNALFQKGVSKCDGFNDFSNHQLKDGQEFGGAGDVFAYINGNASWDKVHLAIIAGVVLATSKRLKKKGVIKIDIKWGGTFGSESLHGWDMPHYEVIS